MKGFFNDFWTRTDDPGSLQREFEVKCQKIGGLATQKATNVFGYRAACRADMAHRKPVAARSGSRETTACARPR